MKIQNKNLPHNQCETTNEPWKNFSFLVVVQPSEMDYFFALFYFRYSPQKLQNDYGLSFSEKFPRKFILPKIYDLEMNLVSQDNHITENRCVMAVENSNNCKILLPNGGRVHWYKSYPCIHVGITNIKRLNYISIILANLEHHAPFIIHRAIFKVPLLCSTASWSSYLRGMSVRQLAPKEFYMGFPTRLPYLNNVQTNWLQKHLDAKRSEGNHVQYSFSKQTEAYQLYSKTALKSIIKRPRVVATINQKNDAEEKFNKSITTKDNPQLNNQVISPKSIDNHKSPPSVLSKISRNDTGNENISCELFDEKVLKNDSENSRKEMNNEETMKNDSEKERDSSEVNNEETMKNDSEKERDSSEVNNEEIMKNDSEKERYSSEVNNNIFPNESKEDYSNLNESTNQGDEINQANEDNAAEMNLKPNTCIPNSFSNLSSPDKCLKDNNLYQTSINPVTNLNSDLDKKKDELTNLDSLKDEDFTILNHKADNEAKSTAESSILKAEDPNDCGTKPNLSHNLSATEELPEAYQKNMTEIDLENNFNSDLETNKGELLNIVDSGDDSSFLIDFISESTTKRSIPKEEDTKKQYLSAPQFPQDNANQGNRIPISIVTNFNSDIIYNRDALYNFHDKTRDLKILNQTKNYKNESANEANIEDNYDDDETNIKSPNWFESIYSSKESNLNDEIGAKLSEIIIETETEAALRNPTDVHEFQQVDCTCASSTSTTSETVDVEKRPLLRDSNNSAANPKKKIVTKTERGTKIPARRSAITAINNKKECKSTENMTRANFRFNNSLKIKPTTFKDSLQAKLESKSNIRLDNNSETLSQRILNNKLETSRIMSKLNNCCTSKLLKNCIQLDSSDKIVRRFSSPSSYYDSLDGMFAETADATDYTIPLSQRRTENNSNSKLSKIKGFSETEDEQSFGVLELTNIDSSLTNDDLLTDISFRLDKEDRKVFSYSNKNDCSALEDYRYQKELKCKLQKLNKYCSELKLNEYESKKISNTIYESIDLADKMIYKSKSKANSFVTTISLSSNLDDVDDLSENMEDSIKSVKSFLERENFSESNEDCWKTVEQECENPEDEINNSLKSNNFPANESKSEKNEISSVNICEKTVQPKYENPNPEKGDEINEMRKVSVNEIKSPKYKVSLEKVINILYKVVNSTHLYVFDWAINLFMLDSIVMLLAKQCYHDSSFPSTNKQETNSDQNSSIISEKKGIIKLNSRIPKLTRYNNHTSQNTVIQEPKFKTFRRKSNENTNLALQHSSKKIGKSYSSMLPQSASGSNNDGIVKLYGKLKIRRP